MGQPQETRALQEARLIKNPCFVFCVEEGGVLQKGLIAISALFYLPTLTHTYSTRILSLLREIFFLSAVSSGDLSHGATVSG